MSKESLPYQVSDLMFQNIKTINTEFGYGNLELDKEIFSQDYQPVIVLENILR